MQQSLSSLVWFVVVLAAIPLALWLLKRSGYGGGAGAAAAQAGVPRTVATLSLSPQQRVMTVEVGQGEHRTWLVLGVSPQGISTLHTLPAGDLALAASCLSLAASAAAPVPTAVRAAFPTALPTFSSLLSRFRKPAHHVQV